LKTTRTKQTLFAASASQKSLHNYNQKHLHHCKAYSRIIMPRVIAKTLRNKLKTLDMGLGIGDRFLVYLAAKNCQNIP